VANFTDPQVSCKKCDAKHRVDKIIEDKGMIISTPLSQVDKWYVLFTSLYAGR
jgi:glycyl-tRNA synthetase (class II)